MINKVKLLGSQERIDEILKAIKNDEKDIGSIDFDKIIPMPEELNLTSGSIEYDAINAYLSAVNPSNEQFEGIPKMDQEKFNNLVIEMNDQKYFTKYCANLKPQEISESGFKENLIELGEKYVSNFQKYKSTTWYDWSINNRGSKWNAYDMQPLKDNTITFSTAWSMVMPVISKIAEMNPDIKIEYMWADEDIGANVGRAFFQMVN